LHGSSSWVSRKDDVGGFDQDFVIEEG
jgi:hypothetical protein